jgi:hypothetical protein
MFKIVIVGTVMVLANAMKHPINKEIVAEIKQKASWEPFEHDENPLKNHSAQHLYSLLGAKIDPDQDYSDFKSFGYVAAALPDNFDASE